MKDSNKDAAPGSSGAAPAPVKAPRPPEEKSEAFLLLKASKLARFPLACRSKRGKCIVTLSFPVKNRQIHLKPSQVKAFASDLAAYEKAGVLKRLNA